FAYGPGIRRTIRTVAWLIVKSTNSKQQMKTLPRPSASTRETPKHMAGEGGLRTRESCTNRLSGTLMRRSGCSRIPAHFIIGGDWQLTRLLLLLLTTIRINHMRHLARPLPALRRHWLSEKMMPVYTLIADLHTLD